jgi:hypothetical protein
LKTPFRINPSCLLCFFLVSALFILQVVPSTKADLLKLVGGQLQHQLVVPSSSSSPQAACTGPEPTGDRTGIDIPAQRLQLLLTLSLLLETVAERPVTNGTNECSPGLGTSKFKPATGKSRIY